MKPICVKCQCFYRVRRNSFAFIEGMPNGTAAPRENIRGLRKPEAWQPYKLWNGDLWECPDCGHQTISGVGFVPIAEHYQPQFGKAVETFRPTVYINDC